MDHRKKLVHLMSGSERGPKRSEQVTADINGNAHLKHEHCFIAVNQAANLLAPSSSTPSEIERDGRRYHHEPLSMYSRSIRLLTVREKVADSPTIHCDIVMTDLESNPSYLALSYMWGASTDQRLIYINDKSFRVRYTLMKFLKYAESALYGQQLWIDGICIDQDATQERNHQVRMMGDIYRTAERVIVWPWTGSEGATRGCDYRNSPTVRKVSRKDHSVEPSGTSDSHYQSTPSSRDWPLDEGARHKLGRFAVDLQYLPYWSRTWVAQEIYLAREISLCTRHTEIAWDKFWDNVRQSQKSLRELACSQVYQHRDRRLYVARVDKSSLRKPLLRNLLDSGGCSEIRDRVYSLLSVVQWGEEFEVDYDESSEALVCRAWLHFHQSDHTGLVCLDNFLLARLLNCLEVSIDTVLDIVSKDSGSHSDKDDLIKALQFMKDLERDKLTSNTNYGT